MTIYPPAPPGWNNRALTPGLADPQTAARMLGAWVSGRGYELNPSPDVTWFQRWAPFVFLFHPVAIGREIRAQFNDAFLWVTELFAAPEERGRDPERSVVSFLTSPRLPYRAALRARTQPANAPTIDEPRAPFNPRITPRGLSRRRPPQRDQFLRRTYGGGSGSRGVIGDAVFESQFEIAAPSREEGLVALPISLRQLLVQSGWRGLLELRPGGIVWTTYGVGGLEPSALDASIGLLSQVYGTLVRSAAPPPAPPPQSSTR